MLEINDYVFEGLPENQRKLTENDEEKEKEKDSEFTDIFIHENDELQKSMMEPTKKRQRQTLVIPNSRLNIEDKNNLSAKKQKLEKTAPENEYEVFNMEDLDFLHKEQESINYPQRSGYFDLDQILQLEDPFMRVSRPSGFNYKRISALDQRVKTTKTKKKKNDYFFKEKPRTYNIKEKSRKVSSKSLKRIDSEGEKNEELTEKAYKAEKDNVEIKEKNEEEEDDDEEGLAFIDISRPSFLSRDSIELEETTFEVEVVDSVTMTILQVINCMIKANLVQIAISMKELGLIWGPITICLIACMSLISLNLILEVNKMTGQRSYLIFSEMIFGHFGSVIILICQFMSAFGGCLSYIVIFNKVVPNLLSFTLSNQVKVDNRIFSIVLGIILFFFCYKQDVNIIKSAAKYAVFAVLLFFFVTILDFIFAVLSQDRLINLDSQWNEEKKNDILFGLNQSKYPFPERLSNIITAVACIILSYSYHIFTFSIYGCMGKISRKQFFITTSVSVLITTIIYLICGTIGYLLYYDYLKDSILDAVQETWLSSLLSLANVVNVIMTFPITFSAVKNYFLLFIGIMITLIRDFFLWAFSCLPSVYSYRGRISNQNISKVFRKDNHQTFLMSGKPLVHIPKLIEILLTILIYFLVFLFASMYTKLKVIFSFTGGVMGNILSFIFPSIFYLGFARKKAFSKYGFVAVFFIIFGFATMSICVTSTIQSL